MPFLPSRRLLPLFPLIRWESLSTLLLPSGRSLSFRAYGSFLTALFYLVYSSLSNLIPFSFLPSRFPPWTVCYRSNSVAFSVHFRSVYQVQTGLSDDPRYYCFLGNFGLFLAPRLFPQTHLFWPPSLFCSLDSMYPF